MVAKVDGETLVLRRTFSAPPETVFRAWTTPEQMRRWLHPSEEFTNTVMEVDLRVGGRYRVGFKSPEGTIDFVGGEFLEILPNERLVYSWTWEEPNEFAGIETLVTVEFFAQDKGTELILTQKRFCNSAMKDRHMQGWGGTLDLLAKVVN